MDPLPYYDEDDMIAEEMDFFDGDEMGPPRGYDDDDDEEQAPPPPMDVETVDELDQSRQGVDTTSDMADDDEMPEDGSLPGPTIPAYRSDEDDDDPASVRGAYNARKRPIPQVLFKFERYRESKPWRDPAIGNSPTTMKANSWKARKKPITSWETDLGQRQATNVRRSMAPDMQILSFLKNDYSAVLKTSRMPKQSVAGKKCFPITLADKSRLFVPMNDIISTEPKSGTTHHHVLGVSFSSIMEKVKMGRRKGEREKLRGGADPPTPAVATEKSGDDSLLWVDKHAPAAFVHLLSNERCNREVIRALREWDPFVFGTAPPKRPEYIQARMDAAAEQQAKQLEVKNSSNPKDKRPDETSRVILLSGPPGVGKTTLAHIAATHVGYRPIEVNGSDERSEGMLKQRVLRAMESTLSFKGKAKPNCIILDEIDGADAVSAIQALVKIIRAPKPVKGSKSKVEYLRRPIIFICNNRYASTLKPLLPYAKHFAVSPPVDSRLVVRLRQILANEQLSLMAGGSLLGQLVTTACGDIRSCLHTLQFATAKARDEAEDAEGIVDISHELKGVLNGNGLKDEKSDIASTITAIFRKEKSASKKSVVNVLDCVDRFHDNPRVLDCLLSNIIQIPYIDPTLERCAAAHDYLSSGDVLRQRRLTNQILPIGGIIHLLCSVERRQDISFSTKAFADAAFKTETNTAMLRKFKEGMVLSQSLSSRSHVGLVQDTIPFVLWALSAGEGSGSLRRGTTSEKLLKPNERQSFERHACIMSALGLTYRAKDDVETHHMVQKTFCMEPPIDDLAFSGIDITRQDIPSSLKELLARKIQHTAMSTATSKLLDNQSPNDTKKRSKSSFSAVAEAVPLKKAKKTVSNAQNFLVVGAKQAKAARHARNAARVGSLSLQRSRQETLAHTGSGKKLSEVVRLKFIKGFTEAVRIPCRMDDL